MHIDITDGTGEVPKTQVVILFAKFVFKFNSVQNECFAQVRRLSNLYQETNHSVSQIKDAFGSNKVKV